MKTELNILPIFTTVAETGSFTAAAEKLHLTRSAVSKAIARLEQRLGTTLFHRTTRNQSLTDEGNIFYEYCRQALAAINTAETLIDSGKLQVNGKLKVSVPVLFGNHCIAPLLTEFALEHPNLKLKILFSDRIVDFIEEGFDMAIRIGPLPDSSNLIARKLTKHSMKFCASPLYLTRFGKPRTIEELNQYDAVGYIQSGQLQKWIIENKKGGQQKIIPQTKIMLDDIQAIANAAVSGAGIAWLPDWLIREQFATGQLIEIMQHVKNFTFPTHIVWLKTPHLPLRIRLAVDKLVSQLPDRLAPFTSLLP